MRPTRGAMRRFIPSLQSARGYALVCLLGLLIISPLASAVDIENARRINKTCSLCHGVYGQGTPGMMSPRLAGLPADYLKKEMRLYRDGTREYAPMVVTSSVKSMSDKDIEDISQYLAGVDLRTHGLPDVPAYDGDDSRGKRLYKRECRTCHKRDGHGKPKKGIPPLAGQYGSYLMNQMNRFREKDRYHADDPEDDLFNQFQDDELTNVIAYLTRMAPNTVNAAVDERLEVVVNVADAMAGMVGMQTVLAEEAEKSAASQVALIEDSGQPLAGPGGGGFAGQFRVTPEGEIVLSMKDLDTRSIAGLKGVFKVTAEGSLTFYPAKPERKSFGS